jgi:hypothetical protein
MVDRLPAKSELDSHVFEVRFTKAFVSEQFLCSSWYLLAPADSLAGRRLGHLVGVEVASRLAPAASASTQGTNWPFATLTSPPTFRTSIRMRPAARLLHRTPGRRGFDLHGDQYPRLVTLHRLHTCVRYRPNRFRLCLFHHVDERL